MTLAMIEVPEYHEQIVQRYAEGYAAYHDGPPTDEDYGHARGVTSGDNFYADSEGVIYQKWIDLLDPRGRDLKRLTLLEGHSLNPEAPCRCLCGSAEFRLTTDETWHCDIFVRCVNCGLTRDWHLDCA